MYLWFEYHWCAIWIHVGSIRIADPGCQCSRLVLLLQVVLAARRNLEWVEKNHLVERWSCLYNTIMDHLNYGDFQEHDQQIAVSYNLKAITYNPPHNSFEHIFPFFWGWWTKFDMRCAMHFSSSWWGKSQMGAAMSLLENSVVFLDRLGRFQLKKPRPGDSKWPCWDG